MKLKFIEKSVQSKGRPPMVTFTKHGYVSFNKSAIEQYELKEGIGIALFQDEEKPKDFYLLLGSDDKYPKLRLDDRLLKTGYSSARLAILEAFGLSDVNGLSVRLAGRIKTEHGSAICLITAPLAELAKKGGANG